MKYIAIISLFSTFLLLSCGDNKPQNSTQNKAEQSNPNEQKNPYTRNLRDPSSILGEWFHYDCEGQQALSIKFNDDGIMYFQEYTFIDLPNEYSGSYEYSNGKGSYLLANLEMYDEASGNFQLSFTKEGQMQIKFDKKIIYLGFDENKPLTFHQKNTPIPFNDPQPTLISIYKAIYPRIFEREVCDAYNDIVAEKPNPPASIKYSADKKQLTYTSRNEENFIIKFDLRIWDYPKSNDKLIGFNHPYCAEDENSHRSGTILFYRYDAQNKILIPLDEEKIIPQLKKRYKDDEEMSDHLIKFPTISADSPPSDRVEIYFYEDEMDYTKPKSLTE